MQPMTTLTEILEKLKEEGYTVDFNLRHNCLECAENSLQIHPEDFKVDRYFRFEGDSNPDDEAIVYAISSEKNDIKGTLVNGYGTYADDITEELIQALKLKHD
jgi:hypothetical protein